MSWQLTQGALERIMTGEQVEKPIFQVLGSKKITGAGQAADRYRLLLSDGFHSISSAMLATQLNEKVESGEIGNNAIIQLDKYLCNQIQPDRRVLIILDTVVVANGETVGQKIGTPQAYKAGGPSAPQAAAAPAAAQQPQTNAPKPLQQQNAGQAQGGRSFYNKPPGTPLNKGVSQAPSTPGGSVAKVHPITSLTPYQNRWTIRARVTNKSGIRTWSNSRGEGKLFSMNLVDESGEIRATLFKDEVDKYYDMVELNKIYYISKATLKTANKQYSNVDNDYEMTFNSNTELTPCDEEVDLPSLTFTFIPINQLDSHQPQELVDVVGVVRNAGDVSTITTKAGKELNKRELHLVDETKVQVVLTLWGTEADNFTADGNPIVAIKGARLSDFGGRSLSVLGSSQFVINPDIPEAHHLRGWFDSVGHSLDYEQYQRDGGSQGGGSGGKWKTFSEAKNDGQATADKPDYFTNKGTITFLRKENCMYMACPSQECNKKVIDQANGQYRCEKCQKEYPNYKWRMILSANVADHSDNQWITCFQDTAEQILGQSADAIGALREQNEAAFDQLFQEATFKSYVFRSRAKVETYNDESRLKTIAMSVTPVDFKTYGQHLVTEIEKLLSA